jgi:hypothetical protein
MSCPHINQLIYILINMFPLLSLVFDFLYTYQSVPITQCPNQAVGAIDFVSASGLFCVKLLAELYQPSAKFQRFSHAMLKRFDVA